MEINQQIQSLLLLASWWLRAGVYKRNASNRFS